MKEILKHEKWKKKLTNNNCFHTPNYWPFVGSQENIHIDLDPHNGQNHNQVYILAGSQFGYCLETETWHSLSHRYTYREHHRFHYVHNQDYRRACNIFWLHPIHNRCCRGRFHLYSTGHRDIPKDKSEHNRCEDLKQNHRNIDKHHPPSKSHYVGISHHSLVHISSNRNRNVCNPGSKLQSNWNGGYWSYCRWPEYFFQIEKIWHWKKKKGKRYANIKRIWMRNIHYSLLKIENVFIHSTF